MYQTKCGRQWSDTKKYRDNMYQTKRGRQWFDTSR